MVAVVHESIWNMFAAFINPGTLYRIRNIGIMPASGLYRPVRSAKCIWFLPITMVDVEHVDTLMIPRHKFDLIPLSNVANDFEHSHVDIVPVYSTGASF